MFLKHWIETRALFSVENEENEINNLIGKEEKPELSLFCFDARDVSTFNPSTREGFICMRMKNGDAFNIDIEFNEFKNVLRRALEEYG